VKALVDRALELTRRSLGYQYGSADPGAGGMDCSGTMHYLLKASGVPQVPRQANEMYAWVWRETRLYPVNSSQANSFEFRELAPGDLLFWSGTYKVERDPPITHVMLYLGQMKEDGRRVMFGASSGRRFEGKSRDGVSVFDLEMPRPGSEGRFVGYGKVPGLGAAASK
jgi:cell wall-associated NlpC family hydrolase